MPNPHNSVAPRSVYLVTTAGHPNYGDELITASWLRQLAERAPNADVWVDCPNPGPAAALLDGLHPRARFVDTLFRLCWQAPSEQPWDLAAWVRHAVNDPGRTPRWIAGIDVLRSAQVLHLVGGGFVNAVWPRHIGLIAGLVAAKGHSHGRTVLTGHSLVPTPPHTAALLANLARDFDVLDLRDEPSGDLLRAGGIGHVQVSADDAFLAVAPGPRPPPGPNQTDAAHPGFMLCLQADMLEVDRAQLAAAVLLTLRDWGVDPGNLGVV